MKKVLSTLTIGIIVVVLLLSTFLIFLIIVLLPDYPYVELTADIGGDVGESLSFTANVMGGAPPYTYVFYFGDGKPPVEKNNSYDNSVSVNHSYSEIGNYNMFVTLKDANGDISIDRQTIVIAEMPPNIGVGDFLYMDFVDEEIESGRMNDHVAIYLGNNTFVHALESKGVEARNYAYFNSCIFKDLVFGYVLNANESQRRDAANWAFSKVGRPYQDYPEDSPKGENDEWYAAELAWGAYKNLGIEIGKENSSIVTVQHIIKNEDTEIHINPGHEVPNYVKEGDMVLMDAKASVVGVHWLRPGYSNDHGGIYLGHDYRNGNYFIHASGGGVSITTYEYYHFWCENFTFWYVNNANQSQRENAVNFSLSQLDVPYQYFFGNLKHQTFEENREFGTKDNDPNSSKYNTSDQWYCVELVWASYYNCNGKIGDGIDIDVNGWEKRTPDLPRLPDELRDFWLHYGPVRFIYVDGGNDIQQSENTTQLKDLSVELTGNCDGNVSESLSFNISVIINKRDLPYHYCMYFGDGRFIENTSSYESFSVSHSYAEKGTYTVVVSVTDANGNVAADGNIIGIYSSSGFSI